MEGEIPHTHPLYASLAGNSLRQRKFIILGQDFRHYMYTQGPPWVYISCVFVIYFPVSLQHKVTGEPLIWFMFQKTKYIYHQDKQEFHPVELPVALPFTDYHTSRGYEDDAQVAAVKQLYGKNRSAGCTSGP